MLRWVRLFIVFQIAPNRESISGRADWNQSTRDTVFGRYYYAKDNNPAALPTCEAPTIGQVAMRGPDASHFLYQLADDFNVSLDVEGPGVLLFSRYNHWHGSPWHYVADGKDNIVEEGSTKDPLHPDPESHVSASSALLPGPLNETWAATKGAGLIWSPIEFRSAAFKWLIRELAMGLAITSMTSLCPALRSRIPSTVGTKSVIPDRDVLELLSKSGTDIAPTAGAKQLTGKVNIPATGAVTACDI